MSTDPTDVVAWLLAGDPSIAWQVERDLLGKPATAWGKTRARVARTGWGYTLQLLTKLGLPPTQRDARASCCLLLERGVTDDGGVCLWSNPYTDTCVTAMLVTMACYFELHQRNDVRRMAKRLLSEQMPDGGWNCDRPRGAVHSSFHTTISSLEALAALQSSGVTPRGIKTAVRRGQDFLLEHQLYRSSTTGKVVRPSFALFSFPTYWFFDVLRGLEHFSQVEHPWDGRLSDPIAVLLKRRTGQGRWHAQNTHSGRVYFRMDRPRTPSRTNTLRAMRVLRWYEQVAPQR